MGSSRPKVTNALAETAERKRASVLPATGRATEAVPAKKGFGASLRSDKSDQPMESDDKKMKSSDQESERTATAKKLGRMDVNAQEESKVPSQPAQAAASA